MSWRSSPSSSDSQYSTSLLTPSIYLCIQPIISFDCIYMMDSKKSNKIREVVRLQQILKKWKKVATSSASNSADTVPKGFLAVCVGKELKRFIIPTHYLRHQAFEMLLQEAQEEFGFQQEGVLKIPCHVSVFQKILKAVEDNKQALLHHSGFDGDHPQTCT